MRTLLCLVALAGFSLAAPVPKDAKKQDDKLVLLGTWKTVTENGKDGNAINTHTYVFGKDDHLATQYGGRGFVQKGVSDWTWAIDTTVTPKKMTWVSKSDPQDAWECAYELDGDSLKIAVVYKGTAWPEKVAAGKGLYVYELKREASGK